MRSTFRQSLPPRVRGAVLLLTLISLVGHSGCSRPFYRQRADKEVAAVLKEKDQFADWKIEHYSVYPDPRSRFADPTNPDFPPMPPDDPAAKFLGPNPQRPRKAGVARIENSDFLAILQGFDAENRAERLENAPRPATLGSPQLISASAVVPAQYLPAPQPVAEAPRAFLINLPQAVELGLINSREFQNRREDLYLTALPVTLERYAFAPQFFFLEEAIRERTGSQSVSGAHNRWVNNASTGFTKLFSTGALLLFRFANQTVVELTGKGPHTVSVSSLNLDIVQPFLRGGGRAVTLEPLTQVERNLLYEIRSYARFRKEFFNAVAGGGDLLSATAVFSRIGGAAAAPGTLGAFRPEITPGGSGRIDLGTGPLPFSEGYLPALLRSSFLATELKNVAILDEYLRLFEAYKRGDIVSPLQVGQVELQLLQGRQAVVQRDQDLRDSLDRFKIQLGLPVDVPLALDQAPLAPVTEQLRKFEDVYADFKDLLKEVEKYDVNFLKESDKLRQRLLQVLSNHQYVQGTTFRTDVAKRWMVFTKDKLTDEGLEQLGQKLRLERQTLLERKGKLEAKGKGLDAKDQERLDEVEFEIDLGAGMPPITPDAPSLRPGLEKSLRAYEKKPWEKGDPKAQERLHATFFSGVLRAFERVLTVARSERLNAAAGAWPKLSPVGVAGIDLIKVSLEEAQAEVAQTALTNRLDLMNARARVTDAWRQVRIFANSLLAPFNVEYHMDSTTPAGQAKPLAFSGSRTRHQLVLNTELPLVRKVERNNYRASLIAYQRERRSLMAVEDRIAAAVRLEIRQLRLLANNYEIQKKATEIAYAQVESALETFKAPPDPGERTRGAAGTAAALTQQLLAAQDRLLRTQNQLFTIWINYQITRLQLYLDLELMPLDSRGVWIDELISNEHRRDGDPSGGSRQSYSRAQRFGPPEWRPEPRLLAPSEGASLD